MTPTHKALTRGPAVDDPVAARRAGADWLSLALIDARNHLLRWLAALENSAHGALAPAAGLPSALWLAGHAAWWAEYWIVRNVQAQRGEAADPQGPRLASVDLQADAFHPSRRPQACIAAPQWDDCASVRAYLSDTLEAVLELLDVAGEDDAALHYYRLALRLEDRTVEELIALAQAVGVTDGPWPAQRPLPDRAPLWLPARRFELGSAPGGLVPGAERWAHPVALPAGEIDAQPVNWARWAEFARDGGYDEPRWWQPEGWAWLQAGQRRAPRYVEQQQPSVVLQRQGRLQRVPGAQAAAHVTRHEAMAWCQWAGRRLPTEAEWERAACEAEGLGFSWGQVLEWVAGRAECWPGHNTPPGDVGPLPQTASAVLRGASAWTPARLAHARARRFEPAEADLMPSGFRSCAI